MEILHATAEDIGGILEIYNQGIEDRIATLDTDQKTLQYMTDWFNQRENRYAVIVAKEAGYVVGWCALNPYNQRCAYAGVGDPSVYVRRNQRGKGIGEQLMRRIIDIAKDNDFHKLVLATLAINLRAQQLYKKIGFREVGVYHRQGIIEGNFVDVMIMELLF
ncbi:MAG: arsinothricin resistance N-acetyltransferase ArsN1 family A [Negativicutes bacterium]|jgi:phosphinothricin acetyltransferase